MHKTIEEITWKLGPPAEFPCMRCRTAYATHFVRLYLGPDEDPETGYFKCAVCWDCAALGAIILYNDMLRPTGQPA